MKKVIHRAGTRGHSDHGWLDSYHTFSFADYHDPERIHFGALRVLNDDTVAGGEGFGAHPHDNMEIVSIPLEGELRHQDSMGLTPGPFSLSLDRTITPSATYIRTALPYKRYRGTLFATPSYNQSIIL